MSFGKRNFVLFYFWVFLLSIGAVIVGKHPKLKKVISVHALPTDCGLFTRLSTWCY
jgi:hypothetical protein